MHIPYIILTLSIYGDSVGIQKLNILDEGCSAKVYILWGLEMRFPGFSDPLGRENGGASPSPDGGDFKFLNFRDFPFFGTNVSL